MADSWTEWLIESDGIHDHFVDARKLLGLYTLYLYGVSMDAFQRMLLDASQVHMPSTAAWQSDAQLEAGAMRNLAKYQTESDDTYRRRLLDAWNIWLYSGEAENTIIRQALAAEFDNITLDKHLGAGGHPDRDIPTYPDSRHHWSQFNLILTLSASIGNGAVASPSAIDQTPSTLISSEQLDTLRYIIKKWKPVDWVCREIIVVGPRPSGVLFYVDDDDSPTEPLYVDDGALPADPPLYSDGTVDNNIEHYPAQPS